MSIHIDRKFLHLLSPKLQRFSRKKEDLYNFRCPLCGDSKKNKLKCRGYIFRKKSDYFFLCHNCGASHTFYNFLKMVDSSLIKEYALERYRNGEDGHHNYPKPNMETSKPLFKESIGLPRLLELPYDHPAREYMVSRWVPLKGLMQLYYAEDFKAFVESLGVEKEDLIDNDKRIVIPFYNEERELVMVQGRSAGESKLRYIAISLKPGFKFFGVDRIDKSKKVYVTEGPIDSTFIPNAMATGDSDLTRVALLGLKDTVLVWDNEPRNKQIVKQVENAIEMGFSVCVWPNELEEKDINDMVLAGKNPQKIIDNSTYAGLRAKLEITRWSKI